VLYQSESVFLFRFKLVFHARRKIARSDIYFHNFSAHLFFSIEQLRSIRTMNKKPTRCTIVLRSLKLYCILITLYMFRALLRPSSGASQFYTYSLQSPCVFGLVVSSSSGLSRNVSGTLAPVIRSLLILHIQPPVTVCRWVGCIFQLWSVTT
jgi:hypothetical protein